MSLSTTVIVNDITNLSEARYCAGMGVHILGFNIDGTEASIQRFNEISSWVAGVGLAATFSNLGTAEVKDILSKLPIGYVITDNINIIEELKGEDVEFILSVNILSDGDIPALATLVNNKSEQLRYVIVNCGNEALFPALYNAIQKLENKGKVVIGFGINANNIVVKLEGLGVAGIALHGSVEERPGFHEYGELMDMLEALDEE